MAVDATRVASALEAHDIDLAVGILSSGTESVASELLFKEHFVRHHRARLDPRVGRAGARLSARQLAATALAVAAPAATFPRRRRRHADQAEADRLHGGACTPLRRIARPGRTQRRWPSSRRCMPTRGSPLSRAHLGNWPTTAPLQRACSLASPPQRPTRPTRWLRGLMRDLLPTERAGESPIANGETGTIVHLSGKRFVENMHQNAFDGVSFPYYTEGFPMGSSDSALHRVMDADRPTGTRHWPTTGWTTT